jgi:mRNA interferase RelE/StbE
MSNDDSTEWRIVLTRNADKSLGRIDKPAQGRLRQAIDDLMEGDVKKLRGRENEYRLRVGNYRVVFTPTYENRTLTILEIFHRGRDYR